MENHKKLMVGALVLALLSGCGKSPPAETAVPEPVPTAAASAVPEETAPAEHVPSPEELAALTQAVEAAEKTLAGFRWPEEREVKVLEGQETAFVRYHGSGWTILVPEGWPSPGLGQWRAPSENAGLAVNKIDWPVNNPKIYRAQQGSWRYETSYAPPFDYYYDDDGGYTPPKGDADYVYFFAPAGEKSYEFTISGTAGETTDLEKAILEAMLLSFTQDDSSRILYGEDYRPGRSEWDFAMAGLLSESEGMWGNWVEDGWSVSQSDKDLPDYAAYALALAEFAPGEFVQFGHGEYPEEMEGNIPDSLILCLSDSNSYLFFYEDSPWVGVNVGEGTWWTQVVRPDRPEECPYDAAMAWMRAERDWEEGRKASE